MKKIMRIVALLTFATCLAACPRPMKWGVAPVEGVVFALDTKDPIEGALVIAYFISEFIGGSDYHTQGYAFTDKDGKFNIEPKPTWALGQGVERAPTILFAHPSYLLAFQPIFDPAPTHQLMTGLRILPDGRSAIYEAERMCLFMPPDACEILLDYVNKQ